jgi:hypothetical protein
MGLLAKVLLILIGQKIKQLSISHKRAGETKTPGPAPLVKWKELLTTRNANFLQSSG